MLSLHQQRHQSSSLQGRDSMQPSLLDRLSDDAPDKLQELPSQRLLSHSALRRQVLRDLQWLLNSINSTSRHDLRSLLHVQRSTFNFGVTALSGQHVSAIEWSRLQRQLTEAIVHFEPRILPQGLQVRCLSDCKALNLHNLLSIEIKGRLWCVPYPLEFLFHSKIDLENGHFELKDVG
ncbi:type VI secretion system baseplate subunit TssE [Pantoea sp. B65]|uniref:type VI secretion system baseplate subunit TssE n=1 Tax=Pantoea sp. B65 TaxID=2813359 RepID=UPI0039B669EC